MQQTLFKMPKKEEPFELIKVNLEDMDYFNEMIYSKLPGEVLYNHCFHYFYSYFAGVKSAWMIKEGDEMIAIGKKNINVPKYFIHAPHCSYDFLLRVYNWLTTKSDFPVKIIDLNESMRDEIMENEADKWKIINNGKDVIFDLEKCCALRGKRYHGMRTGINNFNRNHAGYTIEDLDSEERALDAEKVMREWQTTQGLKYFRVTLGRDIQLFKRFWPVLDNVNTFGIVIYNKDGKPIGVSSACRSANNLEFGMELTTKVLTEYTGLTDFASKVIFDKMLAVGIKFSNEAGYYSPGIKINKNKWGPVDFYEMYELERIVE